MPSLPLFHSGEERSGLSSEREMLREEDETKLGERTPFDSSRQATYEDSVPAEGDWGYQDFQ
jgi:hypothetical protein